jgi:UDP-GlcNAc:undecaprenyl-phosphate/decaprenyl-phosphate GlcNAc-1-phosphate transferase
MAIYPLARKCSFILGMTDGPDDERKIQEDSIPCAGGMMILGGSGVAFLLLLMTLRLMNSSIQEVIRPEVLLSSQEGLALSFGLLGIFLLGAYDDRKELSPSVKLFLQVSIVLAVLCVSELRVTFFVEDEWLNLTGTLVWVILIMNAFNLIDNMDGLCSLVASIVFGLHGILLAGFGDFLLSGVCWLLLGSMLMFFGKNRPKADVYLGDSGSLSLGYLIAMLCIVTTYYHEGLPLTSFLTPILMISVPLFDVASVMIFRWNRGLPLMKGDRNHVSHRLLRHGFSERQVLLILGSLTFFTGTSSIFIHRGNEVIGIGIVIQTFMTVLAFHWIGQKRRDS